MPPKRANTGVSKRGRGWPRATRGRGNAHARVLSDIVEETESQSSSSAAVTTKVPPTAPRRSGSKKRSLDEAQVQPNAQNAANDDQRDTRPNAAK